MFSRLRLAEITTEFRALVSRLIHSPVFRSPGENKYISVFCIHDPHDSSDHGYYYTERLGRDSVAFLLIDRNQPDRVGTLTQWHGPLHTFVMGAYTGSLDKDELSPAQITAEECREEAGYPADETRVNIIEHTPVSGNTNERVYLATVDVTGLSPEPLKPENEFERNTQRQWLPISRVTHEGEWKSRLICHAIGVAHD